MSTCNTFELFSTPELALRDVRCMEPASGPGTEGRAGGHLMVIVRRGVFVRHLAHSRCATRREDVADAAQVLLYNRLQPYRVSHPLHGGDACTVMQLDDVLVTSLVAEYEGGGVDSRTPFRHGTAPMNPVLQHRVQALRTALRRGLASPLAVEEASLDIARTLLRTSYALRGVRTRAVPPTGARVALRQAEQLRLRLATNPGAGHGLLDLARELGASPTVLSRAFRARFGESIHQHLLRLRISLALDHLAQGTEDLSRLALDLGFHSHSHFTSTFRRLVGCSPSSVRAQLTATELRNAGRALRRQPRASVLPSSDIVPFTRGAAARS